MSKCEKCNGVGAYQYRPKYSKEEIKVSTSYPNILPKPLKSTITRCETCNGTGEVAD